MQPKSSNDTGPMCNDTVMCGDADDTTLRQLTLCAADFPAPTLALPDAARDWLESNPGCGMSSIEFLRSLNRSGLSLRMCPAYYRLAEDGTLPPSFKGWQDAGICRLGGSWTLSIGASHNAAAVCSLSDVLQNSEDMPHKYFLSARACQGILRRAERRGKKLPQRLMEALMAVVGTMT